MSVRFASKTANAYAKMKVSEMTEEQCNDYIEYLGNVKRDACAAFTFGQNINRSFTAMSRGYKASDELVRINQEKKLILKQLQGAK